MLLEHFSCDNMYGNTKWQNLDAVRSFRSHQGLAELRFAAHSLCMVMPVFMCVHECKNHWDSGQRPVINDNKRHKSANADLINVSVVFTHSAR